MKLGLHYWNYSTPADPALIAPTLAESVRVADQAGIASFTVMDHYFQMETGQTVADEPMLEGYTTLGYVAAVSERMTLGLMVTGVMYRHPGLLAKIVTSLDVLSGGRARLGIGASWYEREQYGLGVPVVPVAERFERLEETILICLQMWSDDNGPFHGRHYRLAETLCVPEPIGERPSIMIGGGGERKTLLLVARYADACNLFATGQEEVAHKLDVLRAHCAAEDRDYDAITKTVMYNGPVLDRPDVFLADAEAYASLGISEIQVLPDRHPVSFTHQVAEHLAPAIAQIG
ncbi:MULTISPECIES: LLM class F420-dependent oxidoreductase [unclassified Streptomyces]|uniref:LLM class F420-dependent oxidoreductase n=1 Tax=unclassified Streptomyces TaxID=2593676 RepID=UPI00225B31C1|nr:MULTISPECIES: LLM class F420-dependent oxidoreductase [unclassified Streptomyces]WSP57208.1 LLM class F420-dependent oxidoreductase [Streptomyces sp. NBC_01241]WSU22074.1 LLM class F420-dependent oxidoreductase [Streptomyces sp. NBC_01108]WTA37824.1 LLM class F420-dependent oxidoreductase [Streptomyces sp. NBC_00846]MCX4789020.1 LLM class F420-dependent oxidoreductase [Streptomyces sp. NBC_01221]MCX4795234.1 LLM class F420-dependent oxidoreductase [Streptomyces sp. NBC_01242]